MSEFTDNHQIEKPPEASAPWTQAYHDLVDHVEQASEIRAPDNQRSNYEPKANTVFRATDTGSLYIGTGTNWIKVDLRVAEFRAEEAHLSEGKVSSTPTEPDDLVNKEYADQKGDEAGMEVHDNDWHQPPMATKSEVDSLDAETVEALPISGGTLQGLLVIDSGDHRDHLNLKRGSIGNWHLTPTSSQNGSLEISDTETGTNAYISSRGNVVVNSLQTMMTDTTQRFDVQDFFPGNPSTRDVCLRTDQGSLYFYDGTEWVGATIDDGGGNGDPEPSYYVDDFNRSSAGSAYYLTTDGYNYFDPRDSSGLASSRGAFCGQDTRCASDSGLDNYPEAGGGPNNDGAFEFHFQFESFGGSLDMARVRFARGPGNYEYRFQMEPNKVGFREGTTEILTMSPSMGVGDHRIIRMNEWSTAGDIDVSIHNGSGTQLVRQSYKDTKSGRPQSGGIGFWTNASTACSIDEFRLLE